MRVLHVTSELDGGGIDRVLYNYCIRLSNSIKIDFAITSDKEGILEKPLKEKGCNIYRIPKLRDGLNNYNKQLSEILLNGNYDIIHVHSGYKAFVSLWVAKKNGVKIRIAHSHTAMVTLRGLDVIKKRLFSLLTKTVATDLFSCGTKAAQWTWGKSKSFILPNAVDISAFSFSEEKRNIYKHKFGLGDKKVIGIVARLSEEKNHIFLLDVFKIIKQRMNNVSLMVVGTGPLEAELKSFVRQNGIENDVLFTGIRTDVSDLINLFDIFVLPSFYEGVPVTIVEAQANGLACLLSDFITEEICFNKNVQYLSLTESKEMWADKIISMLKSGRDNSGIFISNYNMDNAYKLLLSKYNETLI